MPLARHLVPVRPVVVASAVGLLARGGPVRPAHADIVLAFTQDANLTPNDPFVATNDGASPQATTTFTQGSVIIDINTLGGVSLSTPILAYITYEDVRSIGAAQQLRGSVFQEFDGTVAITSGPNASGLNYLTATFAHNLFNVSDNGQTGALTAQAPPDSHLRFTSDLFAFQPAPPASRSMTLGYTGTGPATAGIVNQSPESFVANGTGQFEATLFVATPEPSSWLLATIGGSTLLGYGYALRRSGRIS
jgi:hypothetical protein